MSDAELLRCPFVRAIAAGREDDAVTMASTPPDPQAPAVVEWLIAEARRQLRSAEEAT